MDKKTLGKLLYLTKKSRNDFERVLEDKARECGITKPEADVLLFFSNNKEFDNAKDAVIYRGFSKSYVSQALKELEQKNYITIKVDETDKRYQHIIINECASSIVSKLHDVQKKHMTFLKRNIDPDDFKIFMKVMNQIVDNMLEGNEKDV